MIMCLLVFFQICHLFFLYCLNSGVLYSQKYNKLNSTLQIDRELYNRLKEFLKDKDISIRDYVSNIIKDSIKFGS